MSTFLKYAVLPKKQMPPKTLAKTLFHNKNLRLPFQKPTIVQKEIIKHIMTSKSACFVSSTGSGKSYGYVIGILLRFIQKKITSTTVIVLPTKELVEQIYSLFKEFRKTNYPQILSLTSNFSEERDKKKLNWVTPHLRRIPNNP